MGRRIRRKVKSIIHHKQKTLQEMTNDEIKDLINQLVYRRLTFPNSPNLRMIDMREQYTERIKFLRDFLNSRKNKEPENEKE